MNRRSAPLYEQLVKMHHRQRANFHVPGHKEGRGLDPAGAPFFHAVMGIDYTEIAGLDDLHHPEGVILEAQRLAAELFGAEETYFLVGGSTVGNLSLITTVCGRGDLLIVQRNVHKSVIHGLMLAGAQAVFISPRLDKDSGLAACVDPHDIEEALVRFPQARGVLLTNPNYYGMGIDLTGIANAAHRFGVPLLVDEAHGAHFGLHPKLPPSALSCGADGVVQSTHKMLGAMTMGAMLHVQGGKIDRDKLRQRLAMLQSSSPSYPIMASLDLSRRLLHEKGRQLMEEALARLDVFRRELTSLLAFREVGRVAPADAFDYVDPFKISICDASGALTGFELLRLLEENGCTPEMADPRHVLLLASFATEQQALARLLAALERIAKTCNLHRGELKPNAAHIGGSSGNGRIGSPVHFDMSAGGGPLSGETAAVPLERAAGRIAAEMVVPYPPGIPLFYPGERITEAACRQLAELAAAGAHFQGKAAEEVTTITVYAKEQGE